MTDDFGNAILDDGVNVKLLNEYFASIFTREFGGSTYVQQSILLKYFEYC